MRALQLVTLVLNAITLFVLWRTWVGMRRTDEMLDDLERSQDRQEEIIAALEQRVES